jgi:hypothetical protein
MEKLCFSPGLEFKLFEFVNVIILSLEILFLNKETITINYSQIKQINCLVKELIAIRTFKENTKNC